MTSKKRVLHTELATVELDIIECDREGCEHALVAHTLPDEFDVLSKSWVVVGCMRPQLEDEHYCCITHMVESVTNIGHAWKEKPQEINNPFSGLFRNIAQQDDPTG